MPSNPLESRKAFRHAADLLMRDLNRRGLPVEFPAALDILSRAHEADWNTMSAFLKGEPNPPLVPILQVTLEQGATLKAALPVFDDVVDAVSWKDFLGWAWKHRAVVDAISIQVGAPTRCSSPDGRHWEATSTEMSAANMNSLVRNVLGEEALYDISTMRLVEDIQIIEITAGTDQPSLRLCARIMASPTSKGPEIDIRLQAVDPPRVVDINVEKGILDGLHLGLGGLTLVGGNPDATGTFISSLVCWHCQKPDARTSVCDFSYPTVYRYDRLSFSSSSVFQVEGIKSISGALRISARKSPNAIILNGPIKVEDLDTVISAASSDTSVISTIAATSVEAALGRLARTAGNQSMMLSSLNMLVFQRMLPCIQGGWIAAREFLVIDQAIRTRLMMAPTTLWSLIVHEELRACESEPSNPRGISMRSAVQKLIAEGKVLESDMPRIPERHDPAADLLKAGLISESDFKLVVSAG